MKKLSVVIGSMLVIGMAQAYAADTSASGQSSPNIAIVNVQKLFQESPKIADLNKQLQNKFKGRQDKLVAAQKSLQDEMDKYKKEEPTMSKEQKDKTSAKIADEQKTLSKDASDFQQDLSKEQNKIMKNVLAQLNGIISSLAKKNDYSLVLDAQAVIYLGTGSTDITKQVSKEFDSK